MGPLSFLILHHLHTSRQLLSLPKKYGHQQRCSPINYRTIAHWSSHYHLRPHLSRSGTLLSQSQPGGTSTNGKPTETPLSSKG